MPGSAGDFRMLKSTHRPAAASNLPPGWTEHRAPTGHLYYYNSETKQSTYTKPVAAAEPDELRIDYGATQPDREVQASLSAMQEFHRNSSPSQLRSGHFTGGKSYQNRDGTVSKPNRQGDRPKSRVPILNCEPWVLVRTKYGRRFVHNTETKESFWKFPSDVMMAVIEMDRLEWEKKTKSQQAEVEHDSTVRTGAVQADHEEVDERQRGDNYDSDEYEEVEVTDDEAQDTLDPAAKRPRLDEALDQPGPAQTPAGPKEFDEDDIAWQLAQMEADESDPGYDYDTDDRDDEDGGMPLTQEDRDALFRSLLDEFQISPFSTFDALIDTNTPVANAVISDDRWIALPNMSARRTAFDAWSRHRVAARHAAENEAGADLQRSNGSTNKTVKADPRITYLRFLSKEATPKLYWPEFKRKYRKRPEMTDRYFPDKDREKLYREYIAKLKLSEADRKKEFTSLLKSASADEWESGLPASIEKNLQFYGVRDEQHRHELVQGFVSTLPKR